jgi:hypothetical protein
MHQAGTGVLLIAQSPIAGEHLAKTTRQIPVFLLTRQDRRGHCRHASESGWTGGQRNRLPGSSIWPLCQPIA